MSGAEQTTLERIHKAAREEFLKKGFEAASLRNIVKKAGVTTGAFYGYYESKEALFDYIAGRHYRYVMNCYRKAQEEFASLPAEQQPENMGEISGDCMLDMLLYAYDNLEEFKILLCSSQGTRYAGMIDEMADIEIKYTHAYQEVLESLGRPSKSIDARLEHILVTGMFGAFFELVIHEMPIEQAKIYLEELRQFYTAGWMKIMGQ